MKLLLLSSTVYSSLHIYEVQSISGKSSLAKEGLIRMGIAQTTASGYI